MKTWKKPYPSFRFITALSLFSLLNLVFISASRADEDDKVRDILEGRRISCSDFIPTLQPTLNFEMVNPMVVTNETNTQISLQMKIIYYRCHKDSTGEVQFKVVEPNSSYKYDVEQLDGSISTVKVIDQRYRFTARIGKGKTGVRSASFPGRIETEYQVHQLRFDLPLGQILNTHDWQKLKSGQPVFAYLETKSALSMEYAIGQQTKDHTGFQDSTSFTWKLRLHQKHGQVKAVIDTVSDLRH